MSPHCDHSQDSDSDHDDLPNPPLPVWLVAGNTVRNNVPSLRAGHSLVAFSNRLYLFGGYCDNASYAAAHPEEADEVITFNRSTSGIHFNSLHEFCYDTGEWRVTHPGCSTNEARSQALPKPRRHASIVVHGGSLFIYGGFDIDDNVLDDLWEYRIETNTWVVAEQAPCGQGYFFHHESVRRNNIPVARAEHTAITYGNRMIIFGGYDGKKKLNDTYVYDFETKQWSKPGAADHNSPSRRCKHSAVLYKKKMYITGGFQYKDGDNYALTDMHVLDLETYVWSTILMGNGCPEALQGHKAVVCGDSMYVLGGKVRHRNRSSMPSPANMPSVMHSNMSFHSVIDHPSNAQSVSMSALRSHPVTVDIPFPGQPSHTDNRGSGLNNAVFRYLFDANKWLCLDTSGHPPAPRQLHAAVSLPTGGGRGSIFLFGGTDKSKQRFYNDLAELRGIRITPEAGSMPCPACSSYSILLGNPMFSDVKFVVEGRQIHAHRSILYARSEYFRHMFDSRMRETSEVEIPIPSVSYDVFRALLEYLYSGRVRVSSGSLAVDLLKAADMFQIEGLRSLCVEKVEQALTVQNAAFICQVADTHNAQHLKTYCITFMMQNFREVIKTESFQTLMRQDPGGLGHEILYAYSEVSPYSNGSKRARK
eukprot:GFKZ01000279.1.p1 GENE.GFKZ01000279.1~~GFKZ01000279.1.p1  ORF type:complete len:647 (+),score=56.75 GFKZ01000279.1:235-2175(+)